MHVVAKTKTLGGCDLKDNNPESLAAVSNAQTNQDTTDDDTKTSDITHFPSNEDLKYDVGSCCDALFYTLMSKTITKDFTADPQTMLKTLYEFDLQLQFWSLVVHICKADGKFGKLEETFVRRINSNAHADWQMPQSQLDQALLGKDLSQQFVLNVEKYWKKLCPHLSARQMKIRCNAFKNDVITYAVLAATQDGLIDKEYKSAKIMAKKFGLKDSCVDDSIELIKAEKELARLVKQKFSKK